MTETLVPTGTLVDALAIAIESAAAYDPNTHAAPVCILWTDEKREWTSLLAGLRAEWPHVLTLGDYAPDARTGPAIWIKTALLQHVPEAKWPKDTVPIVYLPGVSRSILRNAGSLSRELQPLAELQHRGVLFSQVNGKDWTLLAFLSSAEGGLGLDVARDAATADAMARALTKLANVPVERLTGGRLEAEDFNTLLAPDPVRDLLRWLDDPERFQEAQGPQHWAAFRDVCQERFGLDPEKAGPLAAAQRLGKGKGAWSDVWLRFTEAPHRYPKLPERLGQAKPSGTTGDLFGGVSEAWPQDNEQEEGELRAALSALANATQAQATERIRKLEQRHGKRRAWVWADVEKAPLARALKPLVALTDAVGQPGGGSTVEACATAYTEHGWKADDAFLHALSAVKEKDDLQAVQAAALALYRPWLEQQATTFASVLGNGLPPQPDAAAIKPKAGCVWLFVDALRYDAGMRLKQMLERAGTNVDVETRWVAFPSLTPTSKPALSPIANQVSRESAMHDFAPESEAGPLTTHRFRALLKEGGFQVLASDEVGDPSGAAWAEIGLIDKRGHELGWKLACRIDEILRDISARVQDLLDAGWQEVRIVTDHGWLLLPGGLPKTDLPKVLTNVKWGRCAEIKGGSQTDLPTYGWFWNPDVRIAIARGIHVFVAGTEYAHGGLTLQECLVPELTITGGTSMNTGVRIAAVEWIGLRCRVDVDGSALECTVDIRLHAADAGSSITSKPKDPEDGRASLIVPDDTLEGQEAVVVLQDAEGRLLHQIKTIVGG